MKLAMIYSGGTIGCAGVPLEPLSADDFQGLWERHVTAHLDDELTIDWQWLETTRDSSLMTPADWGSLARMVLNSDNARAVLLLHGTDTMAWTAAALAFLLTLYDAQGHPVGRLRKPVVLTGSQRPLFDANGIRSGTDALANLLMAIHTCDAGAPEVTLAFGGATLTGARVMKLSTTADRAFDCPKGIAPCPVLPIAVAGDLLAQLDRIAPHLGSKAVAILTPNPGDGKLLQVQLEALANNSGEKLGAIYLNCFGIGNFPNEKQIAPLLRSAHDKGVLIIAGSQVPDGDVTPSTYGAGHWLAECGAISTVDMAAPAAHAKLHVGMALGAANGWEQADVERFFITPVAGELRS
jgi:L-asparaginase